MSCPTFAVIIIINFKISDPECHILSDLVHGDLIYLLVKYCSSQQSLLKKCWRCEHLEFIIHVWARLIAVANTANKFGFLVKVVLALNPYKCSESSTMIFNLHALHYITTRIRMIANNVLRYILCAECEKFFTVRMDQNSHVLLVIIFFQIGNIRVHIVTTDKMYKE